jgi:hypothetical protein
MRAAKFRARIDALKLRVKACEGLFKPCVEFFLTILARQTQRM